MSSEPELDFLDENAVFERLQSHPNFENREADELACSFYFLPSFIEYAKVDLLIRKSRTELEIEIGKSSIEKATIEETNDFYENMTPLLLRDFPKDTNMGLDGIIVYAVLQSKDRHLTLNFWSPRRGSPYYELARCVFEFLFQRLQSETVQHYLEHLNNYFGFMGPYRVIEYDDYQQIRIYGGLSWQFPFETDYPMQERLRDTFHSLRKDKPILLDMSNFHSMGTFYYDIFYDFFDAYDGSIVPLVNDEALRDLNKMGYIGIYFTELSAALEEIGNM